MNEQWDLGRVFEELRVRKHQGVEGNHIQEQIGYELRVCDTGGLRKQLVETKHPILYYQGSKSSTIR